MGGESERESTHPTGPARQVLPCQRHRDLAVFGSALRDDFGPASDIDVLVEFAPGRTPGLGFVNIADELADLFGRPVDVLTRSAVERSPNFIRRRAILGSAKVVYAA